MLGETRVKPFKWKPFDLYNDIHIESYRKIKSPPVNAGTATTTSAIKGNCCDNFGCNRDHYYRPPLVDNKINRKSFLFGGASEPNACHFDDHCESNRTSNECCVRDKFADASNDIDGDNGGVNWSTVNANKYALPPNVVSHSQFSAAAFTGSAGSSCGSSTASSMSPSSVEINCNTNKVDNKIEARMFRRSIDDAPPIVYGPLPYSK